MLSNPGWWWFTCAGVRGSCCHRCSEPSRPVGGAQTTAELLLWFIFRQEQQDHRLHQSEHQETPEPTAAGRPRWWKLTGRARTLLGRREEPASITGGPRPPTLTPTVEALSPVVHPAVRYSLYWIYLIFFMVCVAGGCVVCGINKAPFIHSSCSSLS